MLDVGESPAAEIDITEELVRGLLAEQHPDLAHLPLRRAGAGWDNAIFRVGDELCMRLPRRALSAPLVLPEQRWPPVPAPPLPLPGPRSGRRRVGKRGVNPCISRRLRTT